MTSRPAALGNLLVGNPGQNARSCGGCTACCVRLGVRELHKPADVACRHQTVTGGCAVYDRRPPSCRQYSCEWLRGHGEDGDRPDLSGVMVSTSTLGTAPAFLIAHELRPGALHTPAGRAVVDVARRRGTMVTIPFDRRGLFTDGPRAHELDALVRAGRLSGAYEGMWVSVGA